ncbi:MAG: glycosyltransferase family 4 protein [Nitrososphaera sp.]
MKEHRICYGRNKIPRLLVFGYPSKPPQVGGLLWSKRVSDAINKLGVLDVRNISSERSIDAKLNTRRIVRNIVPCLIKDFYDAVCGLLTLPQMALLDSWGEASLILWSLLRVFRPHTKIVIVFHHYEPRILSDQISEIRSHFTRAIAKLYNSTIEKLNGIMIRDSDMILTVSHTSARQLCSFYGLTINDMKKEEEYTSTPVGSGKIRIVGTGVDKLTIDTSAQKDIDFFCIGRIEKLDGIDKIWSNLRKVRPELNFVMIGRASLREMSHLRSIGVNHKGDVPDEEKLELYSRAKVFLFPSSREGFGIALAESLHLGMAAVIWRLPVFDELYSESRMAKQGSIRLVEQGNYELFASEALKALDLYDMPNTMISAQPSLSPSSSPSSSSEGKSVATISVLKLTQGKQEYRSEVLQSWEDVADKVVKALSELI